MMAIAETNNPEMLLGLIAIMLLGGYGVVVLFRRLRSQPLSADPWDQSIAAEVARDDAMPLCNRCLTQHHPLAHFCPECGAPVGQYTNWLPFEQLFSVGHVLRVGTSERFKRSPSIIAGFFLFSFVEYFVLAPWYWFKLIRNLQRSAQHESDSHSDTPPVGKA